MGVWMDSREGVDDAKRLNEALIWAGPKLEAFTEIKRGSGVTEVDDITASSNSILDF